MPFKQYHTTKFTSELEMMSMPFCWKLDSRRDKQRRTISVQYRFGWWIWRLTKARYDHWFDSHNGSMLWVVFRKKYIYSFQIQQHTMMLLDQQHIGIQLSLFISNLALYYHSADGRSCRAYQETKSYFSASIVTAASSQP
jgi:hypothetical protein